MSDKRYAFVVDLKRCIGCDTCAVACKMENNIPLGQFRLVVHEYQNNVPSNRASNQQDNPDHFWVPSMCHHCDNAPCITVCPTEALYTDTGGGMVKLDASKCIGCARCGEVCPYDAISYDTQIGTADKCTMCEHRVKEQLDPMCVIVCPTRAIHFGDVNDSSSRIAILTKTRPHKVLNESAGTQPKIFYLEP